MEKLKIGLFIDTWFPMIDGVTNVVNSYAEVLSKVADVTVFTCGTKKKDTRTYPFKVVRSGSVRIPFFDYEVPSINQKFLKEIKNAKLDVVHIHSPFMVGKAGVEYANKYGIPAIATLHSQYYQDFYKYTKSKWISKNLLKSIVKVFNSCDKVYAVNDKMPEIALEYGITPRPTAHYNGTHLMPLKNTDEAYDYFEKNYGIKKDETVFLFVGRMNLIKNLKFTIDALKILKDKGLKFKMLFVGSGSDEEILKQKVKKLELENDVIFTGRVSDEVIVYSYARAKLFLFPSLYDTSSLVQIEAASQKTPTVFIRGSVTSATVTEDVNGFMSANDVEDFANTIERAVKDEKLYNEVSKNCFEQIYNTWDETVMKMYDNYLKFIEIKKQQVAEEKQLKLDEKKEKRKEKTIKAKKQKDKKEKTKSTAKKKQSKNKTKKQ